MAFLGDLLLEYNLALSFHALICIADQPEKKCKFDRCGTWISSTEIPLILHWFLQAGSAKNTFTSITLAVN